jgi:hypothetical protein
MGTHIVNGDAAACATRAHAAKVNTQLPREAAHRGTCGGGGVAIAGYIVGRFSGRRRL